MTATTDSTDQETTVPSDTGTDEQNNPASGDAEEGGFTLEWIETHGNYTEVYV